MNDKTRGLLEYMLEDAQDAAAFAKEAGDFESFIHDAKTRKAIVMSLLNIGELANQLPKEFTDAHTELPWRTMTKMRNIAAHGYHSMSDDIIWDTVQNSVPELIRFLRKQLAGE